MALDKYTVIKFIYKAKLHNLRCVYVAHLFDKIPIYVSKDITGINVIESDGKLFVLIGNTDNNIVNNEDTQIKILSILIARAYTNSAMKDSIIDLCIANWFGFNRTINYIQEDSNIEANIKQRRINNLNKVIKSEKNIKVPSMDSIINSFNYIDVK